MPTRYINPFTDFGFKKIFGEEPNKDLLIDFINALLEKYNIKIKNLNYKKTEHLGITDLDRKVVFDLYCENEKGEKFIVEMQKSKQKYFKDRMLYYSTFPIQEQGLKQADWNYELKAIFAIALLDFEFDDSKGEVISYVRLMNTKTHIEFYKKLTFILIQIPAFNKNIDQLETRLDQWLYTLKHLEKFDRIPEKLKDKIFQKLFKIAEYQALEKDERQAYEDSLKYYRDLKNSLDTAKEEGYKEAEKHLLKIVEQERQKAEEAKRREQEAKLKLAKMMKEIGKSVDEIMKETGLSREEIEKL